MDTTTSVAVTGVIVTAGQWTKDKKLEMRTFIGLGVMALGLAVLGRSNAKLAEQFALLIMVAAIFLYIQPIGKALGYTK